MAASAALTSSDRITAWYARNRPWIWLLLGILWSVMSLVTLTANASMWQMLACIACGICIALRVARPGVALAVAWLVAIFIMAPPGQLIAIPTAAIVVTLAGTTRHGGRVTRLLSGLSVFAGTLVAGVFYALVPESAGLPRESGMPWVLAFMVTVTFLVLGSAWLIGQLGLARDRYRQRLVDQQIAQRKTIEERERANLARDMHDVLAHSLSVMVTLADGTALAFPDLPEKARKSLGDISSVGRTALTEVRGLLARLRAETDDPQLVFLTAESLIEDMRAAGLMIVAKIEGEPAETTGSSYRTVVLLLREALTNALRHGDVNHSVLVRIVWSSPIILEVRNTIGTGHDDTGGHWGIVGMKERISLIGGALSAGRVGDNWVVSAEIPGRESHDS